MIFFLKIVYFQWSLAMLAAQQAQQQQLIQSLGPAALGSKLLDPKNNAQAQQLTEELNANQ